MTSLPRAANVALWLNAWLRGSVAPDDVYEALGSDLHHGFIGLDPERPLTWAEALGVVRQLGSTAALALPAPGDPLGLGGPPPFNASVLEAGEAILFPQAGLAFVPVQVGGAIEWRADAAAPPLPLDPREARQQLRQELREVTDELAELGIAAWSTEIPDLLMNRGDGLATPPDLSAQDRDALLSAALCLTIVNAARAVDPGAISANEWTRLEAAIRRLDRAARRVLVAVCSC